MAFSNTRNGCTAQNPEQSSGHGLQDSHCILDIRSPWTCPGLHFLSLILLRNITHTENCIVQKQQSNKLSQSKHPHQRHPSQELELCSLLPPPHDHSSILHKGNLYCFMVMMFSFSLNILSSKYVSHLTLWFSFPGFWVLYKWNHSTRHSFVCDLFHSMK